MPDFILRHGDHVVVPIHKLIDRQPLKDHRTLLPGPLRQLTATLPRHYLGRGFAALRQDGHLDHFLVQRYFGHLRAHNLYLPIAKALRRLKTIQINHLLTHPLVDMQLQFR